MQLRFRSRLVVYWLKRGRNITFSQNHSARRNHTTFGLSNDSFHTAHQVPALVLTWASTGRISDIHASSRNWKKSVISSAPGIHPKSVTSSDSLSIGARGILAIFVSTYSLTFFIHFAAREKTSNLSNPGNVIRPSRFWCRWLKVTL